MKKRIMQHEKKFILHENRTFAATAFYSLALEGFFKPLADKR